MNCPRVSREPYRLSNKMSISFHEGGRMESDHNNVSEHNCCVDMGVVQSGTTQDRNTD